MGNSVYDLGWARDQLYVAELHHNRITCLDVDLNIVSRKENIPTPHGLKVDADGCLYVATYRHGRILKFDPTGKEILHWDQTLIAERVIEKPLSVDIDSQGKLWFADYGTRTILRVDTAGNPLMVWPEEGAHREQFLPHGVTVDTADRVWVPDRAGHALKIYSPQTQEVGTVDGLGQNFDPLAIRFLHDHLILVPDYSSRKLWLLQHGSVVGTFGDGEPEAPCVTNLAITAEGLGFLAEERSNRIQKVDLRPLFNLGN